MDYISQRQFTVIIYSVLFYIVTINTVYANNITPFPQQLLNEKILQAIDREQIDLNSIKQLLNKGASATNKKLLVKALQWHHADILQHLLIQAYPSLTVEHYDQLLTLAIKEQDWKSVEVLLKHSNQAIKRSLLIKVAEAAHVTTFKALKTRKIIDDSDKNTNKHCAIEPVLKGNNNAMLNWFLTHGMTLKDNKHCDGLLTTAIKNNNSRPLLETLIKAGVAINGDDEKPSPIQLAIEKGHLDLVKLLLKKGAVLRRHEKEQPLVNAAFYGHTPLLDYLLGREKKSAIHLNELAMAAAKGGKLSTLQFLQQRGADLSYKTIRPQLVAMRKQDPHSEPPIATTTALHFAAEKGHLAVVRYLLETIKLDVNEKEINILSVDNTGTLSALHYAVEHGDYLLVQLLLQYDADTEAIDQQKGSPLLLAVQHNHLAIVRLLVNKDVAYQHMGMPELPLQAAVLNQNLPMVTFLLNNTRRTHRWQSIINKKNQTGSTALHYASQNGNVPLVQMLLSAGARADIPNADGETALHRVLTNPHHDVFRLLLKYQYQINVLNKQGQTPLAMSIANNDGFYVAELLANKANIQLKNQQQQTLLHQLSDYSVAYRYRTSLSADLSEQQLLNLISNNDISARIEWLLRHKIDINAQDDAGNTALHYLADQSEGKLLQRLLQQKPDINRVNQQGNSALFLAVHEQTNNALLLLQAGADPNQVGEEDKTPLYLAVEHDNLELVEQLIQHGAKVNQLNKQGQNPLFALVDAGTSTEMVERLIAAGVDLKNKDQQGNSIVQALSNSRSKYEALPRLQLMLEKGADPNVINSDLSTPLHQAVLSHAPKTAQLLLSTGANPNAQDKDGATPLHYAVRLRAFKQIEQLIAHKATLNLYNRFGKTALHIAVEENDKALVKRLLKAGASLYSVDKDLRTPLITAIAQNDTTMALLLIQHKANVNALSKGGWRPLHFAVKHANNVLVKALLKQGADRQQRLWNGDTLTTLVKQHTTDRQYKLSHLLAVTKPSHTPNALLQAAKWGKKARLEKLLQQGADINIANAYGQTALHFAIEAINVDLVIWLLEQGANPNQADLYQQTPLEKALLPDAELATSAGKILAALLAKGADINKVNRHSETLLLMAVRNKTCLKKIQLLLTQGANVNVMDYFHNTPLLEASRQGKAAIVEALVGANATLTQQNQQGNNSLHLALSTSISVGIPYLLTPPQDLKQLTREEIQMFASQAEHNYQQVVSYLLEQGIDSNATNSAGQSPLALAVQSHRLLLVKQLLADNNSQADDSELLDLAHSALQQQQFGIAKVLLQHNADISLNTDQGWEILKTACANTYQADHAASPIIELLLAKGAKQQLSREGRERNLLEALSKNDALESLQVLQQADVTLYPTLLQRASQDKAVKIVRFLLKKGIDIGTDQVNQVDASGKTALMFAAEVGAKDIVALLLAQKMDIHQKDKYQSTALEYALQFNGNASKNDQQIALHITKQLIKHGANPALVPQALQLAIKSKNDALIAYLIDDLHYKVNELVAGNTALHIALKHFTTQANDRTNNEAYNKREVQRINYLINNGADINRANQDKVYPVQQALNHPLALALLLQYKVQTDPINAAGDSLIHLLMADNNNDEFTQSLALLLQANITATLRNKEGNTPLHLLLKDNAYYERMQQNQRRKLALLLKQAAVLNANALNAKNNQQQTPLSIVLAKNTDDDDVKRLVLTLLKMHPVISDNNVLQACHRPLILKALLKQGANVNSRNEQGVSCLQRIFQDFSVKNTPTLLQLLLAHDIDINQQDKYGKTALHDLVALVTDNRSESEEKRHDKQYAKQQVLNVLWQHKPNLTLRTHKEQYTALFFASDAVTVKALLQQGMEVNSYDYTGNTRLQNTHDLAIAKVLLENSIDIEHKNKQGETALFIALKNNEPQIIDYLLAQGANPNIIDHNGNSVLHAIHSIELAKKLLAKDAKVNHRNQAGNTPLHTVHSLALAKLFIDAGAKLNQQNKAGQTPLIHAIIQSTPEKNIIAEYLIEQGADVRLKDQWGETALFKTAYSNNLAFAKQLLARGSKSDLFNTLGDNPLHIALSKNHWQMAELLINLHTATVLDQPNWQQKTPLAFTFEAKHFGIAKLLSSRGASKPKWPKSLMAQEGNPFWLQRALQAKLSTVAAQLLIPYAAASVDDSELKRRVTLREYGTNKTNLQLASAIGATDLIEPLLNYGAMINTVDSYDETALHYAIKQGHLETIKQLLAHNASLEMSDNSYNTVLHLATKTTNTPVLNFFLSLKSPKLDINAQNENGETALHIACYQQDIASVKRLLNHKAAVNLVDDQHMTPLLIAAKKADEALITTLLAQGADVNARDDEGRTSLLILLQRHIYHNKQIVEQRDHDKILRLVERLISYKADLHVAGNDGRSAIHLAMPVREIAHHILDRVKPSDLHRADKEGDTPLFHAVRALYSPENPAEITARLLSMDSTLIKHKNKWGETALQKALQAKNIATIHLLIEAGVDINAENKGGYTPLLNIVRNEIVRLAPQAQQKLINLLLTKGADINKTDARKNTSLHLALSTQQDALAHFLIAHHAKINQKNNHGDTPLHLLAQRPINDRNKKQQASSLKLVDVLLTKKTNVNDVNYRNENSSTPLHLAAERKNHPLMARLLANGADVDAATTSGETALQFAVRKDSVASVKLLLAHHAYVAAKNNEGNQALHYAAWNNNKIILKQLLQAGADMDSANHAGETARIILTALENIAKAKNE